MKHKQSKRGIVSKKKRISFLPSETSYGAVRTASKSKKKKHASGMRKGKSSGKGLTGIVRIHPKGFGFIDHAEHVSEPLYFHKSNLSDANDGDLVRFSIFPFKGKKEGKVEEILQRNKERFVGTFVSGSKFGKVFLDNPKFARYVRIGDSYGASDGDKVLVLISDFTNMTGDVVEVLGNAESEGMDILSLAKDAGIRMVFPKKVMKEASEIPEEVMPHELDGREDFRNLTVITIDGIDSKDFDDAIHIRYDARKQEYELGVHIADVAHYVKEGSKLDAEARKRGTSVYLLDRVIPMLPKNLSNGICSLNEGVDRLTLSCIMTFDREGNRLSSRIRKGVIRSRRRCNYDEMEDFLQFLKRGEVFSDEDMQKRRIQFAQLMPFKEDILLFSKLAVLLNRQRKVRGAVDFDFPEMEIELERGVPVRVYPRVRNFSHRLIEEFMLQANEAVSQTFALASLPFLYRIHERPDEERLAALSKYSSLLGYPWNVDFEQITSKQVQSYVEQVQDHPILSRLVLRSMKQAKYSPVNEGHFGLSARYYSHFTSPIRRYPDLYCHRIIGEYLKHTLDEEFFKTQLADIASHSSEMERLAEMTERSVLAMKSAEFMEQHIGEEFEGTVTGITSFGMFVELENLIQGLVKAESMHDDIYEYYPEVMKMIGTRTGKSYSLGEKVKIIVVSANKEEKKVDFELT